MTTKETDMTAPERIWANAREWPKGTGRIEVYAASKVDPDYPATEYTRADLHSPEVLALVMAARGMRDYGMPLADQKYHRALRAALAAFQEVK